MKKSGIFSIAVVAILVITPQLASADVAGVVMTDITVEAGLSYSFTAEQYDLGNYDGNISDYLAGLAKFLTFENKVASDLAAGNKQAAIGDINQQLFAVQDMANAMHDAFLPDHFPLFEADDTLLNKLALDLGTEIIGIESGKITSIPPATISGPDFTFINNIGHGATDIAPFLPFDLNVVTAGGMIMSKETVESSDEGLEFDDSSTLIFDGSNFTLVSLSLGDRAELMGTDSTINASNFLLKGGIISPGHSPGNLTINAAFDMESGSIDMEIGGSNPGSFDFLSFGGSTKFNGGDINIDPYNGFIPTDGQTIKIFDDVDPFDFTEVNVHFGNFGNLTPQLLPTGEVVFSAEGASPADIGVPEPSSLSCVLVGMLTLVGGRLSQKMRKGRSELVDQI
jgi:hypothetical protein